MGFTKRRFFRILLTVFRWCRISVWLMLLVIVGALLYLHLVGIPEFAKRLLVQELRDRGFNAEFSDVHLGWTQEILISNLLFGKSNDPLSPSLSVDSAEVRINYGALLHREFKLDSFSLSGGALRLPLSTNSNQTLSLEDVQFRFKLLPGDTVRLENTRAKFRGISIHLEGVLTNFSAISTWTNAFTVSTGPHAKTNQNWQAGLQDFVSIADKVVFSAPPELYGSVTGDARDPNTIRAEVRLTAAGAKTPWGEMTNFKLKANCSRIVDPGSETFAMLHISADQVMTTWGGGNQIDLRTTLSHSSTDLSRLNGKVEFGANRLNAEWTTPQTNWIKATELHWQGAMEFSATNLTVFSAEGAVQAKELESCWGSIDQASIAFHSFKTPGPLKADATWGAWGFAEPYTLDWQVHAAGIKALDLELQSVTCTGSWNAPKLVIEKLNSRLYSGQLDTSMNLDVASREFAARVFCDVDVQAISSLLPAEVRQRLRDIRYEQAPRLEANLKLVLPAWSDPNPDWRGHVLPTLQVSGKFASGEAAFRDINVTSLTTGFAYTNRTLTVSDLHVIRPEGELQLNLTSNDQTDDFRVEMDSRMDPRKLILLLVESPAKDFWLDAIQLAHPPIIHAEAAGNWRVPENIKATASLDATNLVALGQPIGHLTAGLEYTNAILKATDIHVTQGDLYAFTPLLQMNFKEKIMTLSNAVSTLNPRSILKGLEPILPPFLQVIGFENPPKISVNGWFSVVDPESVDLHFQIDGERFRYSNLLIDQVSGTVNWTGPYVQLTNVQARLYNGGAGSGWAYFDCKVPQGTDIRFDATIANVDMHSMIAGLSGKEMKVEGKLDASVSTQGNSEDRMTWKGSGSAEVRDALLWDIPMFGFFSKVLNEIKDGAGNSRAREAAATFVITNGAVFSEDLHIRVNGARLVYRGLVNEKTINAKVEAQVLRDTPVVGKLLSVMLMPLSKFFGEYHIVGPVSHPIVEPVYVPGMVLDNMLHPGRFLRSILPTNLGQDPAPVDSSSSPPVN